MVDEVIHRNMNVAELVSNYRLSQAHHVVKNGFVELSSGLKVLQNIMQQQSNVQQKKHRKNKK